MLLLFNHRVPLIVALQPALELLILFGAFLFCTFPQANVEAISAFTLIVAASMFALASVASIAAFGLYQRAVDASGIGWWVRVVLALSVGFSIAHLAFTNLLEVNVYLRSFPMAVATAIASMAVVRFVMVWAERSDWLTYRVLVLGTGEDAVAVEQSLAAMPQSGVSFVGFYPCGNSTRVAVRKQALLTPSVPLEILVEELRVHEVIVAVREQRGGSVPLSQLLACRLRGVRVTDLSGFFERMTGEVPVDALKASWLIYGDGFRQGWLRRLVKRCFDVVASTLLLVVGMPIMLVTALAIYFESGGPILFFQERVGLGGRVFRVIKFRSMRLDAERDGTPRWATSNDARVTKVGRVIRRMRIDELPQILNVLKGEMSFVGPRPERPYFVSKLSGQIPFYAARHTLKPGVTGWAQVRCSYGASIEDATKKLQYDLYYVKNHTLLLDLAILLRTIKVVLSGEGAH
jgi:sugar transferase (PEP-CTERM system associated)